VRVTTGRRLTVSEASRVLGLSRTTLLAAEEAGQLTAMRTPGGHRRYDVAELRRYAERAGAVAWHVGPAADPPVDPTAARSQLPGAVESEAAESGAGKSGAGESGAGKSGAAEVAAIAAAIRAAVRPLARALEADSVGLYLLRAATPQFTAAFGVPRWLAERLTAAPPPAPVVQALDTRKPYLFDPAEAAVPEPRATGHGVTVALHRDGAALGVLFAIRARDLAASDVRVVEALGDVLAMLVADEHRIVELERRLEAIAALARPMPGTPGSPLTHPIPADVTRRRRA
jgi:excisionase family DNA binding protein